MPSLLVVTLALVGRLGPAFAAAPASWDRPLAPKQAQRALRSVIKKVYAAAQRGRKPVVLFDIDDTTVDGRARLHAAAKTAGLDKPILRTESELYANVPAARRAEVKAGFAARYFNDPQLARLDVAQKGAPAFLRLIERAGGRVVYASGRWESTRTETEAMLTRLGLPLAAKADLLLNPSEDMPANAWKLKVPDFAKARGSVVAYFDNEARAVEGYRPAFPGADGFRLATFRFHEPAGPKPADVAVIRDFTAAR